MTVRSPGSFVSALRKLQFPDTFNPYTDQCDVHDKRKAPELRTQIILEILTAAADMDIDAIWIGRDLGHRGGRRTGLALTDDVRFADHLQRWEVKVERPTSGALVAERTAAAVWKMLDQISDVIFLWNIFPLHPYPAGNIFGNRAHNAVERKAGTELLRLLLDLLNPRRVVAIGNAAAEVLEVIAADIELRAVRHPGYGGETIFREQVAVLYGLALNPDRR